jgi:predicted enzyme related to lactoylglutathione lyase
MDRRQFIVQSAGVAGATLLAQAAQAQDTNPQQQAMGIRLTLTAVWVPDQAHALTFYTETLGFVKKQDVPMGGARWLTVVSPHDPNGTELLLEPLGLPAAKVFQKAIYDMGVPFTAFQVNDIQKEYDRLTTLGVKFRMKPAKMADSTFATFDDTCGNFIQLFQAHET